MKTAELFDLARAPPKNSPVKYGLATPRARRETIPILVSKRIACMTFNRLAVSLLDETRNSIAAHATVLNRLLWNRWIRIGIAAPKRPHRR